MIYSAFLQKIKIIDFTANVTYDNKGFAVLPSYTVKPIYASVQPLSKSEIRLLPEGTHYADFMNIISDYKIDVDNTEDNLGDYFIYQNHVFKVMSAQAFRQFTLLPNRQTETLVARDNRLVWNPTAQTINLPYPEIDLNDTNNQTIFTPLFDLIRVVRYVFSNINLNILWMYQLELRPSFPFCGVNIEKIIPITNTNYRVLDDGPNQTKIPKQSRSYELHVSFNFYTYDRIQTLSLMETFRLHHEDFIYGVNDPSIPDTPNKLAFLGFEEKEDSLREEIYENRTIFSSRLNTRFSLILETFPTTLQYIEKLVAQISYRNPP